MKDWTLPYEAYTYTYNAKGQRTSKTYFYRPPDNLSLIGNYLRNTNTNYTYDNSGRLIREKRLLTYSDFSTLAIEFIYLYDESGIIGVQFTYGDEAPQLFYYQRNLQGDVVAIYNTSGVLQAAYSYNTWGNCTVANSTNARIANYNPIRYRGYYLDSETNWYFLNARYYSPEWRRFVSPSNVSAVNPKAVNGLNLYVYANNNPTNLQYSVSESNGVTIREKMVDYISLLSEERTTFLSNFGFVFPELNFKELLKDALFSLSEVSSTLLYSLTKNGQTMIKYHQIFDGIDGFTVLDNLPHPVNGFFKGVGISLSVVETLSAGYESYNSGHSFGQGMLNVTLTGGKNVVVYKVGSYVTVAAGKWVGAKLGASIGSFAGPVGTIAGVAAGTLVGYLIDEFGNAVIDWIVGWFD